MIKFVPGGSLLFISVLAGCFSLHAQSVAKTIPGIFIYDLVRNNDHYIKVSGSGNSVVTVDPYRALNFIDINKGTIIKISRNMTEVSPDHRYMFKNDTYEHRRSDKGESRYAFNTSSAGVSSDTILRTITGYYALAMDEQNNFIATKVFNDSVRWHPMLMVGLYRVDRVTGKQLQTLRTDTLFTCMDPDGCLRPSFIVQKNYLVLAGPGYNTGTRIFPFGKQEVINFPRITPYNTDSNYLYTLEDSTIAFQKLSAYDVHTGKLQAAKSYARTENMYLLFAFHGGKIYRYDYSDGKMYEDQVVNGNITNNRSWQINTLLNLSKDQYYEFAVFKGPSFFFAPVYMQKGEAGGEQSNTAGLYNASSNKVNLKVYPFFNRNANDVAKFDADAKKEKEFLDKIAKEKAAEEKRKADRCNPALGVGGYKRGQTFSWDGIYMLVESYDCKKDEYRLWKPKQPGGSYEQSSVYFTVSGLQFRDAATLADKQYYTCEACDGDGHKEVTIYTTKTKDLPWGYFSGIETKKITTKSTTAYTSCNVCDGQGIILK
jgi:hypothetical protein